MITFEVKLWLHVKVTRCDHLEGDHEAAPGDYLD